MSIDWSENNNYLKGIFNNLNTIHNTIRDPIRIAAFDLDDTIIHKSSPRSKSKKSDKWKLVSMDMITKIHELIKREYIIVIFSNQAGMINKSFNKVKWRQAMNELIKFICKDLESKLESIYVGIYVAKNYDMYRKPNLGLWNLMKTDLKIEFKLSKLKISKQSFYVGDAAGRLYPSPYKKKLHPTSKTGDHSDVDRKFALNVGLKFLTPEDFMMKHPPKMKYQLTGFDPKSYLDNLSKKTIEYEFTPRSKELIIMVGPPGSGKSDFVSTYIEPHDYVHINQDTCKTRAKCLNTAEDAMAKKKSIVIDNTNPDVSSRMQYTLMALKYKYTHIRCIIFDTDIELAKHLANVRHLYSDGKIPNISPIVYHVYRKKYTQPQREEHFDKIETIHFDFDRSQLRDPKWMKFFMMYTESLGKNKN